LSDDKGRRERGERKEGRKEGREREMDGGRDIGREGQSDQPTVPTNLIWWAK
jgi:hypothetical protein